MIARIVTGSGRTRKVFDMMAADGSPPPLKDKEGRTYGNAPLSGRIPMTKEAKSARLDVGNIIKTNFLFRGGRGFKAAKARGAAMVAA